MFTSEATTRGIRIAVRSAYIPERSLPEQNQWFFVYRVRISNEGTETAKLISRHWIITDANNQVQEVRGLGVVGEQPLLLPQETFEYTSGAAIATPVGTMRGSYRMQAEDGENFDAPIPEFTLSIPRVLH